MFTKSRYSGTIADMHYFAFLVSATMLLMGCQSDSQTKNADSNTEPLKQSTEETSLRHLSTPEVVRYEGRALVNGQIPIRGTGIFPRNIMQVAEQGYLIFRWPAFGSLELFENTELYYKQAPESATSVVELYMNEGRAQFYVDRGRTLEVVAGPVRARIGSESADSALYLDFSLIDPYFVLSQGTVQLRYQQTEAQSLISDRPRAVTLDTKQKAWYPAEADLYPSDRVQLLRYFAQGGQ
jgi:hypothetical protein